MSKRFTSTKEIIETTEYIRKNFPDNFIPGTKVALRRELEVALGFPVTPTILNQILESLGKRIMREGADKSAHNIVLAKFARILLKLDKLSETDREFLETLI